MFGLNAFCHPQKLQFFFKFFFFMIMNVYFFFAETVY